MARPKEFDRDTALDRAMELFWCQGYEATSLQDLLQHMGIGRQSLYDTFGNKRQLFLSALDRYGTVHIDKMLHRLQGPDASVEAIREYFADFVRFYSSPRVRRGCLVANSTLELVPHDEEVTKRVKVRVAKMETAFVSAIKNAMDRRELQTDKDAKGLAHYFTSAVMGLGVLAKGGASRNTLRELAEATLTVLD